MALEPTNGSHLSGTEKGAKAGTVLKIIYDVHQNADIDFEINEEYKGSVVITTHGADKFERFTLTLQPTHSQVSLANVYRMEDRVSVNLETENKGKLLKWHFSGNLVKEWNDATENLLSVRLSSFERMPPDSRVNVLMNPPPP